MLSGVRDPVCGIREDLEWASDQIPDPGQRVPIENYNVNRCNGIASRPHAVSIACTADCRVEAIS